MHVAGHYFSLSILPLGIAEDLLSRLEIVAGDKSVMELIAEYELLCPLPDFEKFSSDIQENPKTIVSGLEDFVNRDLEFRDRVIARSPALLEEEMFLFGRPLFQILQSFGLLVSQQGNRLYLKIKKS